MTLPALFFGLVLSSLYGAAFHLWKGGGLKKLLLFLILAWVGFWAGHLLAARLGWTFLALGPVNTGMATLGSALVLFVGDWLSQVEVQRK
ncbi:MAG: hypothetical protein MUO30_15135 [Anaerolineales bacterium]|jgi:hypothetical protein|nr:hypothetical protein [Anaerolineales bacterium]